MELLFLVILLILYSLYFFAFQESDACSHVADIAFIVDSSASISGRNYNKVKLFISKLASKFEISPSKSRAAVVLYSTDARTEINFNDYTNINDFSKAVQSLRYQRGKTRIDKALQRAHSDLFGSRGTSRRDVQRVAIVLTDGRQAQDPDAISLDKAAKPLREEGVYVLAIGVGSGADRNELRLLTENDDDVFMTDSFDGMLGKMSAVSFTACQGNRHLLTS